MTTPDYRGTRARSCPACWGRADVLTVPGGPGDGDPARCDDCDWRGAVAMDEGGEWLDDGNLADLCEEHNRTQCRICSP